MTRRARPASGDGLWFLLAGLAALACAPDEDDRVACLFTDEECIEEARLRGVEVVLVDAQGNPVDRGGTTVEDSSAATIPSDVPFWRLHAGEDRVEGTIGFMGRDEGRLAIQMVSDDAVNLYIVVPEEGETERQVEDAWLAFGRGRRCELVQSEPPFHVRLVPAEGPWVAGRYAGSLACPDYSLLPVRGTFRLREEEEG